MAKDATLRWTTGGPGPSRLWAVWGKKSVTSLYATRVILKLRCNTINTFTLSCSFLRRVCAVLQDTTVAMYITVCYHQRARRGTADSVGGAAGRAGCCATHITMHFLLSSINQRGADCAAGGGAGTVVCFVYHRVLSPTLSTSTIRRKCERTSRGGGGCCCAVLCYVVTYRVVRRQGGCCTTAYYHQ